MSIHGGLRAAAAAAPTRAETRRGRHREVQGRTERRTRSARTRLRRKTFQHAAQDNIRLTHARARQRATAERTRARPFPLLSPRAAESGATTRLRVSAAIFTVFSAGKKATRGEEEISTARVYSHAAGTAHGTRRPDQTPRNRPLHQPSTTPVRRPWVLLWVRRRRHASKSSSPRAQK